MAKAKAIRELSPTVAAKNCHIPGLEFSAVICAMFIPKIELTSRMGAKLAESQHTETRGGKGTVQICK
jgi:hypothetical protein